MEIMHSAGRQSDVFSLQFSTVYVNDGKARIGVSRKDSI
jgi:hypothetical protein